jgi:uncharacterized protein YbjT (DUF2867 family)
VAAKTIAVVGATGAQGGGLVRAILAEPNGRFVARALTRKPGDEKAQALAKAGAEVVAADLDDVASLRKAFEGAYGAFGVTPFWEHFSTERELAQAKNMAQAAKDAGVKHFVWSTLEDSRRFIPLDDPRMPTLQGKYKVPHFDAKGEGNAAFEAAGVPTTYFHTSFYWENLIYFGMAPKKGEDGKLGFVLPTGDALFPSIGAEDIGRCAYGAFERPDLIGRTIGVAGDHLTGAQMAAELSRALGQEVVHRAVPPAVYRTFGFPGADDLGNMFQFNAEFSKEFCALRDLAFSRSLNPQIQTFAQWLATNKERLPLG